MIQFKCGKCGTVLESPSSMIGQEETCPQCGHLCVVSQAEEGEQVAVVSQADEDEQAPVVSPRGGRRALYIALGVGIAVLAIGAAVALLWPAPTTTATTPPLRSTPPTSLKECIADRRLFNADVIELFLTLARDHPEAFAGEVYVTGSTVDVGTQDMFAGFSILATWKRLSGFRGGTQASLSKTGSEKTLHAQAGTLKQPLLRQEVTAAGIREILGPATGVRNIDWVGEVKTYYDGAIGFVGTGIWIDGPRFFAAAKK